MLNNSSDDKQPENYWAVHWRKFGETYNIANGVFVNNQEMSFAELHSDHLAKHIFHVAPGRLICNLGCGKGTHSIPLEHRSFRVVNLDNSVDALKLTRQFYLHEELVPLLVCADMEHLPFRDGTFDGVMNFGVMEHFKDIAKPYGEMIRTLKPNGVFHSEIVTERYSLNWVERRLSLLIFVMGNPRFAFSKVKARLKRDKRQARPEFYENSYPLQDYENIIKNYGVRDVRSLGIRPMPLIWLPPVLDRLYAALLRWLLPVTYSESFSSSKIAKRWCPIWLVTGRK